MVKYYIEEKNGFIISTNPDDIDYQKLHNFLANDSYWSQNIPLELLKKAISNSLSFSVLTQDTKLFVVFARLITDKATFAYLADVYIDSKYRGSGLGKWLINTIMNYSEVQGLRNWLLFTKDAHGLYEKFGWEILKDSKRAMVINRKATELYKP